MIKGHKILTIIPARGGSQRLPRKNIKLLAGKPLIAHAIGAVLGSNVIDRVIVSTEDKEIAKIAVDHGAEVPFMRPPELAGHLIHPFDVLLYTVKTMEEMTKSKFDLIVLIQPTTPLVQTNDIDSAIEKVINLNANSCVSVCEISERPEWMYRINSDKAKPFSGLHDVQTRSQDLPKAYRLNGAVYVTRREIILNHKKLIDHDNLSAIVMPRERSVDIDEAIDFEIAEIMLKNMLNN